MRVFWWSERDLPVNPDLYSLDLDEDRYSMGSVRTLIDKMKNSPLLFANTDSHELRKIRSSLLTRVDLRNMIHRLKMFFFFFDSFFTFSPRNGQESRHGLDVSFQIHHHWWPRFVQRIFFFCFMHTQVFPLFVQVLLKSSLLLQFTDKRFQPVHKSTIGKIEDFSCWDEISRRWS